MEENKYTFEINTNINFQELKHINKLYKIEDSYSNLDDIGKTLINEVIRYCEKEEKFPNEKDMKNNKGYISRSQFNKYFKDGWIEIYNYITRLQESKPLTYKCNKCKTDKEFNSKNFRMDKNSKFGLKKVCKECEAKHANIRHINGMVKKYNIPIDKKYNPITWYDKYIEINMTQMPYFCYEKDSIIKVIRHIFYDILHCKSKEDILNKFIRPIFEEYRIVSMVDSNGGKYECIKMCFPEFKFSDEDYEAYNEEKINLIIKEWIEENGLSVEQILNMGIRNSFNKNMSALYAYLLNNYNMSQNDMFIKYFDNNNILHPMYNRKIIKWDFKRVPTNFWLDNNNIIERIKYYCEHECEESILNSMNDTEGLRIWIYKYFKQKDVGRIVSFGNRKLYDILVDAYPQIKINHILFEWEWTQCNNNDKAFIIQSLREFILYRMNEVIKDFKKEIPTYINRSYISEIEPKFNKNLDKGRFKNYYEWCCLAFPEFANDWTPQDFDECIAYDGAKCGSMQELMVYEFLKRDMNLKYIKNIGNKRAGKYTFKLDKTYNYERFCPDFIIEYDNLGNELSKPIVLEYYGMYDETHVNQRFIKYTNKTKSKNLFYNSLNTIDFIAIYPVDIKNNFDILKNKIEVYKDNLYGYIKSA